MPNYFYLRDAPNGERIVAGLKELRKQLDDELAPLTLDNSMRLATWNIREFDSEAYGDRVEDSYYFIAEIISRFDIVAIQEVRRDLRALETLMKHLGYNWRYLVSDTTEGTDARHNLGNNERLAYVYDTRKVRFTGLAGELVL